MKEQFIRLLKNKLNKKVKGFTIVELLITLVLTSVTITFAYGTLSYIQKLFNMTKEQQRIIQDYANLSKRLGMEFAKAEYIKAIDEKNFEICKDSLITKLELNTKCILIKNKTFIDTFHLFPEKIESCFFKLPGENPIEYINELKFKVNYSDQHFNFYFYKQYDAALVMKLIRETNGRN